MKELLGKPYSGSHDWNQERHCMYSMAEESTTVSDLEYILDSAKQRMIRSIYDRHLNFILTGTQYNLFAVHLRGAFS